jgi:hypothetical protein
MPKEVSKNLKDKDASDNDKNKIISRWLDQTGIYKRI